MRLLVAGADRVDAGKTTFSVGLVDRIDGVGFKPRAANDYWFDHDDYRRTVDDGRLYGKDARHLASASAEDLPPEAINPIHRLWRPLSGSETGIVGPGHRQFVCDRIGPVGADGGEWPVENVVYNRHADIPERACQHLPLDAGVGVESVEELDAVSTDAHSAVLSTLRDRIQAKDRAVIESYADIARPIESLSVEAVAVVEPGRARIFDGNRYMRACSVASSSLRDGRLERSVEDVVDPLDPVASVRLPPLPAADRSDPDAISDAYEVAYDALIGAAVA